MTEKRRRSAGPRKTAKKPRTAAASQRTLNTEKPLKKATKSDRIKTVKRLVDQGKIKPGHVTRLGVRRQSPGEYTEGDRKVKAMLPGYRVSKNGKLYYEGRPNRSDTQKQLGMKQTQRARTWGERNLPKAKQRDKFLSKNILKIIPIPASLLKPKNGSITYLPDDEIKKDKVISEKQQMDIVKSIARKYYKGKIEYAFCVDKYGNVLYIAKGDEGSVDNPNVFWWMAHNDDRLIHCHNHPGFTPKNDWHGVASTFSKADLKNTSRLQRRDCCVVGHSGVIHRIKIINPKLSKIPYRALSRMYDEAGFYGWSKYMEHPDSKAAAEKLSKVLNDKNALPEEIKKVTYDCETVFIRVRTMYVVEKYISLCNEYKGGKAVKWIEDHL